MASVNWQRRQFLKSSAAVFATGAFASCGDISPVWRFLTPFESVTLGTICDQIIPPDDFPGAVEVGVLTYIDRQLVNYHASHQSLYRAGLHGVHDTSVMMFEKLFSELHPEELIRLLQTLESNDAPGEVWKEHSSSQFFNTVVDHTMQGYYSDPRHGGNKEAISWRMIGVPHPPIRARRPAVATDRG